MQKSKQGADSDMADFVAPWGKCNNQVVLDLSSALVSFAEKAFGYPGNSKWDNVKVIASIQSKMRRLIKFECSNSPREDKGVVKMECEMFVKKLLLMVDQTKKDLKMISWLHMPPTSDKYQYYDMLCVDLEANGYQSWGVSIF